MTEDSGIDVMHTAIKKIKAKYGDGVAIKMSRATFELLHSQFNIIADPQPATTIYGMPIIFDNSMPLRQCEAVVSEQDQAPTSDYDFGDYHQSSRLWARFLRFWHCLWYTFTDFKHGHRSIDLVQYYSWQEGWLRILGMHRPLEIGCECGKTFWQRKY